VATATFRRLIERDVESLIGLQLSYSFSAPVRLGDTLDAFKADLRAALLEANPNGIFREEVVSEVIIATRPTENPTGSPPLPLASETLLSLKGGPCEQRAFLAKARHSDPGAWRRS
jgi:hypothetical protein